MPKDIHVPARIIGGKIPVRASLGQTVIVTEGPDTYTGPVTVTPTEEPQTLQTNGKLVKSNISVDSIPSEYIIPTGDMEITENGTYDVTEMAQALVNVPSSAQSIVKGSFTGNGGLFVSIPCDFDPDIVYIFSPNRLDNYTVSSGGVTLAILITSIVCMIVRKTSSSNTSAGGFLLPTSNNKPGKVYDNGTLTIYVPSSAVYKFADGETYNYILVKLS